MMFHPNIIENEEDIKRVLKEIGVVAVVGMRDEAHSDLPAYLIPKRVQESGIRVIPVNPKISASLGEKAYPTLAEVPERFDTINVFRRSEAIPALTTEILALPKEKKPTLVWIQTGIRHDESALKMAEAGIKVIQDACLGVYVSRYRR